jgi:hypothetical protein
MAHAAFWAAIGAALLVVIEAFRPAIPEPGRFVVLRIGGCFVATAVIRWLSKQDRLLGSVGVSRAGLIGGGVLTAAVVLTILDVAFARSQAPAADLDRQGLVAMLLTHLGLLAMWSGLYFGHQLSRERGAAEFRAMEAESLALRNELHLLQQQVSPHFLFNSLNTIAASRDDPEAIDTVTQALADYLRFMLRPSAVLEPLATELDAIEQYLTIQAIRFRDRLVCRVDCDRDVRRIPVLPMMVQPLVENAVKYGSGGDDGPLQVAVRAWRKADRLFIEVANTGRWIPPDTDRSPSTGLQTLRRRLALNGGPEAVVTTHEEDGWVRVVIHVPLAPEYAAPANESVLETAS